MKNELVDYFLKHTSLAREEITAIVDQLTITSYREGTMLLCEGEYSHACYYILKGCIRQYILEDGKEKTTAFFTENQAVVSFQTYAQQKPSSHYWVCNEDVTAIVGDPRNEQEMYQQFPKLESVTRLFIEQDFGRTQEEFANFVTSSPEKRYLDLLEDRPELLQRVPQHQIASYLGVTPESLSRIRKRLMAKKK
jgi:CRP-like cAMP-binding protein